MRRFVIITPEAKITEIQRRTVMNEWIEDMLTNMKFIKNGKIKAIKLHRRYQLQDSTAINFQSSNELDSLLNFFALRTDAHAKKRLN